MTRTYIAGEDLERGDIVVLIDGMAYKEESLKAALRAQAEQTPGSIPKPGPWPDPPQAINRQL